MALIGSKKRKTLTASLIAPDNIIDISSQSRLITDGYATSDLERLYYKNCPVIEIPGIINTATFNPPSLIDMNRRSLVYKITSVLNSMERTDRTKINTFRVLVEFFNFCDDRNYSEIFSVTSIRAYIEKLVSSYHSGTKGKTLIQKQSTLRSFIKEFDQKLLFELKDYFFSFPHDSQSITPYSDNQLKVITESLEKIYFHYSECIERNEIPKNFPLESVGGEKLRAVKGNVNIDQWKYDLSRSAYFLTCLYTGLNSGPLLSLKHADISIDSFKEVSRGKYKLSTVKGRQGGRVNYLDVGFTRKAKEFLKNWLLISKNILCATNEYVFPKILKGTASKMSVTGAAGLSDVFIKFGLPSLQSSRFRKTKASIIMRATESLFSVAEGLGNTVETANKHYLDGDPTTSEFSLAAALDIRQRTAFGDSIQSAKDNSQYKFKDPIREKFLSEQEIYASSVANGLRCTMPFGEKAEQLKKILMQNGLTNSNEKVACFKFFDCFSCPFHAVIAEIQDIWLLLSFKDVILESLARPAANSIPSNTLSEVAAATEKILSTVESSYPKIYKKAFQKYLKKPHPLWSEKEDLKILLGVYQ